MSYTLKLHAKDATTELNISNFIEDRKAELKIKEKPKKPKKLTKKCQDRLFQKTDTQTSTKKTSIFDRLLELYSNENKSNENEINDVILYKFWTNLLPEIKMKKKLIYSNSNEVRILLEQSYLEKSIEFCEKLESLYKKSHPDHKDYKRANIMFEFWKNLSGSDLKNDEKLFGNAREVIRVLEKFYSQKINVLCKMFYNRFGLEVDDCKDKNGKVVMTKQARLFKFWKQELVVERNNPNKSQRENFISNYSQKAQDTKKLKKIDFECDENIIFLIDEYFKQKEFCTTLMVFNYFFKKKLIVFLIV